MRIGLGCLLGITFVKVLIEHRAAIETKIDLFIYLLAFPIY